MIVFMVKLELCRCALNLILHGCIELVPDE